MIMTLADMQPGQSACVVGLNRKSPQSRQVRKYLAMGLVPGVEVTLLQRFPAFVFEMGYSQFAVDADVARAILVRLGRQADDDDA